MKDGGESSFSQRWAQQFTRLNEVEVRLEAGWGELRLRAWLEARLRPTIPAYLLILPRAAAASEAGPPCPGCADPVQASLDELSACTACLQVYHRACLRAAGGCVHVDCRLDPLVAGAPPP